MRSKGGVVRRLYSPSRGALSDGVDKRCGEFSTDCFMHCFTSGLWILDSRGKGDVTLY